MNESERERMRRWRMVLGQAAEQHRGEGFDFRLEGEDQSMDQVLQALYDSDRRAGLGSSCPSVNRWLGDIRTYFPTSVVQILQRDALERLNLQQMLLEPETLSAMEPDVHLVGTLLSLKNVIPGKTKQTARRVVRTVVEDLERRLRNPLIEAVRGAVHRAARTRRPRSQDIDWDRTIRRNLKNYLPEHRTLIAAELVGFGRRQSALRDIVLCVDQSGSMATSVVYSSIFAAVLASLRAVQTRLVVFDTSVVDLTDQLQDPVDVLFGTQLGGGTDIDAAVAYCQQHITRPAETIFVLITDLFEGGDESQLLQRCGRLVADGVTCVCLLALNDDGAPCSNESLAADISSLGIPTFACSPDLFPELMASAIQKRDLTQWAARHNIVTARPR